MPTGNPITPTNGENLALDSIVTGVQVTFDRDMRVSTFDASDILSLVGPIGPIAGPFTVQPVGSSLRVFNILFATPQQLSGSYFGDDRPEHQFGRQHRPDQDDRRPVDANQNAALDQLRGGNASNGTTSRSPRRNGTPTLVDPGDPVRRADLDRDRLHDPRPGDPDTRHQLPERASVRLDILSATLVIPDPNGITSNDIRIPLFSHVSPAGSQTPFHEHGLRRQRPHAVRERGAALCQPLSVAGRPRAAPELAERPLGEGHLCARDHERTRSQQPHAPASDTARVNSWSMSMGRAVPQTAWASRSPTRPRCASASS